MRIAPPSPAALGRALALLAAVGLCLLSLHALREGYRQQARLDRAYALSEAVSQLTVPLRSGTERDIREAARALFERSELGFSFIALRDAQGRVIASFGRFENLPLPFLSAQARGQLRHRLYRMTSDPGQSPVMDAGERLGEIDYAHAPGLRTVVESAAVRRLRWVGLGGALLSLVLLGGLWLVFRDARDRPREQQLRARLESPAATNLPGQERWPDTLARLAERLGVAYIITDPEARIVALNETAQALCGWPATDAEGRLVYSVFHAADPSSGQPVPAMAELALERNATVPFAEYRLKPRVGKPFLVEAAAALLPGEDGRPQGAIMLFRDHSETEVARGRVERERRLFERLLDGLDLSVITLDGYGRVQFANAAAQAQFGYTEGRLAGMSLAKLMPVPFLNQPDIPLTRYLIPEDPALPRVIGWRQDATTFPVELRVQPLSGEGGGHLLLIRDLSHRQVQENRLRRLQCVFDQGVDEAYVFDAQTLFFLEVSAPARAGLGYADERWRRMTPLTLAPALTPASLQSQLNALRGGQVSQVTLDTEHQRADGSRYPVRLRLQYSAEEQPPVFVAFAQHLPR